MAGRRFWEVSLPVNQRVEEMAFADGHKCDACGTGQAIYHVTLKMEVFSDQKTKLKVSQFWLCADCERANQQIMTRDENLRTRVARRLSDHPSWLSRWRDWRGREWWSDEQRAEDRQQAAEMEQRARKERKLERNL